MRQTVRCAAENLRIKAKGLTGRTTPVGRLRSGVGVTSAQVDPYRWSWETHNARALEESGPLLVVLGDSAAQGIGASGPFDGWVGQVVQRMRQNDGRPWRVVNLSVSGARARDVLNDQLPRLWRVDQQIELVICSVGGNDMYRSAGFAVREHFTRLVRTLPAPGQLSATSRTVLTTLPQGLGRRRAAIANGVVRELAPTRGIEVAELWATTGPPWQGKYAEDFFHPNDIGYGYWADAIAAAVMATSDSTAGQ